MTVEFTRETSTKFGESVHYFKSPYVDNTACTAFVWTGGIITGIACLIGIVRTILRMRTYGQLDLDDALLITSMFCALVSAAFIMYCMDYFFLESQLLAGQVLIIDANELGHGIVSYLRLLNGVTDAAWVSIFSVKFCYLMFFEKLTKRLGAIRKWWWFVIVFNVCCFFFVCCFTFWICHDFNSTSVLASCSIYILTWKPRIWNKVTGAVDIFTDLLIISIPIILLCKVRIDTKRKFAIGAILSLSAFMIATAAIRMIIPTVNGISIDGPWYFFWLAIESSLSIIMVSITAFKSLFQIAQTPGSTRINSSSRNTYGKTRAKIKFWSPSGETTIPNDTEMEVLSGSWEAQAMEKKHLGNQVVIGRVLPESPSFIKPMDSDASNSAPVLYTRFSITSSREDSEPTMDDLDSKLEEVREPKEKDED